MKPFLLLQVRPEDVAADNEYEAFMKFGNLNPDQLRQLRIHTGEIPEINLDNYSGILLGGGPYCVTDPPEKKTEAQQKCEAGLHKLLDQILQRDFPFLGTCFIGVVVEHAGGKVSRRYPEVTGGYEMQLTSEGHKDKLTSGLPGTFIAYSSHKESCEITPDQATLLVTSNACPVQMLRFKENIYITQFHPELDAEGLALRIMIYKNHGYFPPEDADKLIEQARMQKVTQPVKILHSFTKIYGQL